MIVEHKTMLQYAFTRTAMDLLANIECDLATLERLGPRTPKAQLDGILQTMRVVWTNARSLQCERLKLLGHLVETAIDSLIAGRAPLTQASARTIVRAVACMREMVEDLDASNSVDCEAEICALESISAGETLHDSDTEKTDAKDASHHQQEKRSKMDYIADFEWNSRALQEALQRPSYMYLIVLDEETRSALADPVQFMDSVRAFGHAHTPPPHNTLEALYANDGNCAFIFSTVLEIDLLPSLLGVPYEKVSRVTYHDVPTYTAPARQPVEPVKVVVGDYLVEEPLLIEEAVGAE